jgi:release factor glutamine methyltransferase
VTLKQALQHARDILQSHNIENSSLTAEVLLRHTLKLNRVQLYQAMDTELSSAQENSLRGLIKRHLDGEPMAYITGHKEFYGLDFCVDPRALIPRPETELLVEKAFELAKDRGVATIADIGTGCGTIAISLALNLPLTKTYATDISALSLELALYNCQQHKVLDKICLLEGDMLEPLPEPVDIIIANLPYVKEDYLTNSPSLSFEPRLALDGGKDGLSQIRRFCTQVNGKVKPGGSILLEIGEGQSEEVVSLLLNCFPKAQIEVFKDFGGADRVVWVNVLGKPTTE